MKVVNALVVIAIVASAADAGVISRVNSNVTSGSPPATLADGTLPSWMDSQDSGPIAGASIQAMTERDHVSTTRIDRGARGQTIGTGQLWLGWRQRWLTAVLTIADPAGEIQYNSALVLATPTTPTRVYGIELRAATVGRDGNGIAVHLGWRAHRVPYTWDYGNCRNPECSLWLSKSAVMDGEAQGIGWIAGLSWFLPSTRWRGNNVQMFIGAGVETQPRVADRGSENIDCSTSGLCSNGGAPKPPEAKQEVTLEGWTGVKMDLRHVQLFVLGFVNSALEEDETRYAVSSGVQLAW